MVAVGVTLTLVPVTVPTPLLMLNVVAFVTAHERTVETPDIKADGVAIKLEIVGAGTTVTVAFAVDASPAALVAVSVYVVVLAGDTFVLLPVTVPTPLSMLKLDAPVTDQLSVELPPDVMVAVVAVKLEITGAEFVELEAPLDAPPQPEIAVRRNNPMQKTRENRTERRS